MTTASMVPHSPGASPSGGGERPTGSMRTLWLLLAIFVLPFVGGTSLYLFDWRPQRFGNHGELVQPLRVLPSEGLRRADGQPLVTAELQGVWWLAMPVGSACKKQCEGDQEAMYRLHVALNKEQTQLRRVLITDVPADATARTVASRIPDLTLATWSGAANAAAWRDALPLRDGAFYLVDPIGNVMMRYDAGTEVRGVLKDIERLLKYSWIRHE